MIILSKIILILPNHSTKKELDKIRKEKDLDFFYKSIEKI